MAERFPRVVCPCCATRGYAIRNRITGEYVIAHPPVFRRDHWRRCYPERPTNPVINSSPPP